MALPKLNTPSYELEIPSTDEKVQYRPFLVKEEKILLIALESGKNEDIINALKEIVSECTFNKLNVASLPMFDIEYIFLNIRAKSVGEVSKLKIRCPDDKKTMADVEIDLNSVNVEIGEGHTNKIELEEGMGIIMQYPTIDSFKKLGLQNITAKNMTDIISACILQIYENNGEKVYNAKDQTIKELSDFIEQMNTKQFREVQKFFDTMPKLKKVIKVKNPKTKVESEVTLAGLNDFFG
jgi:hypothetical protein